MRREDAVGHRDYQDKVSWFKIESEIVKGYISSPKDINQNIKYVRVAQTSKGSCGFTATEKNISDRSEHI